MHSYLLVERGVSIIEALWLEDLSKGAEREGLETFEGKTLGWAFMVRDTVVEKVHFEDE